MTNRKFIKPNLSKIGVQTKANQSRFSTQWRKIIRGIVYPKGWDDIPF